MNTREYIEELKIHLRKLPDEDREDAISYYFEYLTEAGPGGAEEAMARLGTPAQLAAGIRADRAWEQIEDGGANLGEGVSAVWRAGVAAIPRTILAVFVTAIVIVIFFAIIIALFASSVGLMAGGIAGLAGGFIFLPVSIPPALFLLGCALVIGAGGFLLFRFSIWVSRHLLYGIAGLFNGIRRSKQAKIRHKAAKRAGKAERQGQTNKAGPAYRASNTENNCSTNNTGGAAKAGNGDGANGTYGAADTGGHGHGDNSTPDAEAHRETREA